MKTNLHKHNFSLKNKIIDIETLVFLLDLRPESRPKVEDA